MKTEKEIRKEIFDRVKQLYKVRKRQEKFIPGKTRINYAGRVYDEKEMIALVDASLDFWLTAGRYAKQFEEELAKFLGVKYCLLTNSGSSANLLAISALSSSKLGAKRLKPGDEVITTPFSFISSANCILYERAKPVFVDIKNDTLNIDPELIEGEQILLYNPPQNAP